MKKSYLSLILVLCSAIPFHGISQVSIANWTFDNTLVASSAANYTGNNAQLGPLIPTSGYASGVYYGQDGWPTGLAINANSYLEFSIAPDAGYLLSLTALELRLRRSNLGSPSGGGPRRWILRSSLDGFTNNVGAGELTVPPANYTVTMGPEFVEVNGPVIFRLYGYDTHVNSGSSNRFVFENIRASGFIILPAVLATASVSLQNNNAVLTWANTDGNAIYSVERSLNGEHFETVQATIQSTPNGYIAKDTEWHDFNSNIYYRIKGTSPNGTIHYSDVLKVQPNNASATTITKVYTNGSNTIIDILSPGAAKATIQLTTMDGKPLLQQHIHLTKGNHEAKLATHHLQSGLYIISLFCNGKVTTNKLFLR